MFRFSNQAKRRDANSGRYDLGLVLAAIALASIGVVMIASSSIAIADGQHVGPFHYLYRHLLFLGIGIAVCATMMRIELAWFERHAFTLLLFAVIALLLVFVPGIGVRINGARRWVRIGIAGFQSVELVKLLFIVYMASYLVRQRESVQGQLLGVIKPIGVAGVMVGLLLLQPDFGSAALIIAITIGMVWLGGARLRNLIVLGSLAMPALAWAAMSQDYRMKRLTSFMDPWQHPFDDGFQLTQALIAIGRGEWFGVGLGASVQKLFYLPEAHTDFIFAVIAEELGFVGILVVLCLFALLVGRAFMLGMQAIERGLRFAGFCAFGIGLWLGLQTLVSIGVNLGVLPTKGLTLPLISSGGSSVLMTCAAIGMLLRISFEVTRQQDSTAPTIDPVTGVRA
ncbi:MAG TPA: putative lipid II flippase FtsW [Rudaea sp.]|nr:putative lipid II flippase FtsW [Rudaea sp.]